jgi:hypothetical protein
MAFQSLKNRGKSKDIYFLSNPNELTFAQNLFRTAVVIGDHCILLCQIKSQQYAANVHTIHRTERNFFVPLEAECKDNLKSGFEFK